MDIKETLAGFKKKIDVEIEDYLTRTIKETEKIDKTVAGAIKQAKKIVMSGGKRARAAFMYYGYLAAGGKDMKRILKTSVSIELTHLFLLIHDDIIDRDNKRHGIRTIHSYYEELGKRFFKNKDFKHFGNSMAIIIGDTIGALGSQVIFTSGFDTDLIVKALNKLQKIVSMTVIGESEDIRIENKRKATENEILKMYEYKTAKYTFEGPLHLGAILARADEQFLKSLSSYAIPAGIAFQIQDDILGIFGSEKKLGKPVGSDVRQGKQTILVAKALEKANNRQKNILEETLGKKDLTVRELDDFRKIIVETGSLEYAQDLSRRLVYQSKKALDNLKINNEARDFLAGMADYMINREL
jgi:geranylgeranyl diphosphate synthase type I